MRAIERVEAALLKLRGRPVSRYLVPSLWLADDQPTSVTAVDPIELYLAAVQEIRTLVPPERPATNDWSRQAVVYNMFVRTSTAFDHDGNGELDLPCNADGFRESGTFLKSILLLRHIKRLGATAIHVLPITTIGRDGNKGALGSPYAIRNPYALDETLAEPVLGLGADVEFAAFVEAAHAYGIRVVVEFVFRTAARDSDWVLEHPEWFYWIYEDHAATFGPPAFSAPQLERINNDVANLRFGALTPPGEEYRNRFSVPPPAHTIVKEDGRLVGTLADGRRVIVPGAFCDWPPDDQQALWSDVTYLRMYTTDEFNYVAYNTIRMYDTRFARPEFVNRELWDRIAGIIPHFQREFGIDGAMIDMGQALPSELRSEMVQKARAIDSSFAMWDETFDMTQLSRDEGYNAVIGYLFWVQSIPNEMADLCARLQSETLALPFFATAETHNTRRAAARPGGTRYSWWTLVFNSFVPAIPVIHSGFELGEVHPLNTGIGFSNDEIAALPCEQLALFSAHALDWTRKNELVAQVASVMAIRDQYRDLVSDANHQTFRMVDTGDAAVLAYERSNTNQRLVVVTNTDVHAPRSVTIALGGSRHEVKDRLTGAAFATDNGTLKTALDPGGALLLEL